MTVNTKMKAIADEVRDLTGATSTLTLDAMASNLSDANDEVSSQADLIGQIVSALEGKAAGGGSGGGSVETCTVTISLWGMNSSIAYASVENGSPKTKLTYHLQQNAIVLDDVLCGGVMIISGNSEYYYGLAPAVTGDIVYDDTGSGHIGPVIDYAFTVNGAGTIDMSP